MRPQRFLPAAALLCLTPAASAHDTMPDTTGPEIIKAIVPAIQKCWAMPPAPEGQRPHAQLKVKFNADGSLNGAPEIVKATEGEGGQAFTQSTVRAVQKCAPYDVLLKHPYERWREILINFDPQ
ncbi:MAG: cell envelope integrity protein TolA [Rhizobiaceae bacterium]